MALKWLVYTSTYLTYSIVHSIRTCWASLKTVFIDEPFEFSQKFLGTLDMVVLFLIAILLNIFGGQVQRYSRKKLLFIMLIGLTVDLGIIFVFMIKEITTEALYFVFYGLTGILVCLAWPICLYTTSQYFTSQQHPTAISMWSSVSQFGDFVAFLITLLIISGDSNSAYAILTLMILHILLMIFDFFFFRDKGVANDHPSGAAALNQVQTPQHQVKDNLEQEVKKQSSDSELKQVQQKQQVQKITTPQQQGQSHPHPSPPPVTFLTVWLLPGVALPVLAFSTVKSINAIIISWMVVYFNKIGFISESRIIAIVWPISIVLGGFIGSKINRGLNYVFFIISLFICGFIFYLLEELHVHPNQIQVIALIAVCGLLVGGPFNQLGTSVPLKLSEDPQICKRPRAKTAIISLMQSFSQMICGISILIVPGIGVMKLHLMAGVLCFLAVILLMGEQLRKYLKNKQNPIQQPILQQKQIKQIAAKNQIKTKIISEQNPVPVVYKNKDQYQLKQEQI